MSPTSKPNVDVAAQTTLKTRHMSMIAMGGVIGAGLFVSTSSTIHIAGPAILVAYMVDGLLVFLLMRMLGELSLNGNARGNFVHQIRRVFGPFMAFMVGWSYWLYWIVTATVEAVAAATILAPVTHFSPVTVVVICVAVMTLTNLISVRSFGEAEFWLSCIKITTIIAFMVVGTLFLVIGYRGTSITHLWQHGGFSPHGWRDVVAILPAVMFTFAGAEIATVAACETEDPSRSVSVAVKTVALRILVFYVGGLFFVLCMLQWDKIDLNSSPFLQSLGHIGINGLTGIMTVVVCSAVLSSLNSSIYVTSRVLADLSVHGEGPSQWRKHWRGVPVASVLAGGASTLLFSLIAVGFNSKFLYFLINASGAVILFNYLVIALAHIRQRYLLQQAGQTKISLHVWLFPYLSWSVVASVLFIFMMMALSPSTRMQILCSITTLVVLALFGCLNSRLRHRHNQSSPPLAQAQGIPPEHAI
ncbi:MULTISPECIES: amino acid permease [Acetobacter]|jgi:AAT family amino acid transporter/GABA permease|uniref:AAT family amino acid transporter/GABA permease n=1 Tax=Acetobacter lovaniensis TaxID=104100 RepID=A0A841QHA3_9PROT|nr:amino acid permease [Acetobacter lovaniensis]MBB6457715.1 AAT family amino acid transporter/GABA permease [Acetobacter lovaniensis]MCP1239942.1 amino acid permease [Acetobacter lovaniensis]NHN82043.1 amino acid permease [Acetobacter lovaniensis]